MDEQIINVLNDLSNRFGIAIDWSSQNVVPYLQELAKRFITYNNVVAIFWIVISVIIIVASLLIGKFIIKSIKNGKLDNEIHSYEKDDWIFSTRVIVTVLVLLFIIIIGANIIGVVKNYIIPEVIIVNYIHTLL